MKKIIFGFLSLTLFLVGQVSFAANSSVTWNTNQNDCPTINIATPNQGGLSGRCWTGTNITANAGEKVEVKIYYHNTGTQMATRTHIKLYQSSTSSGQSSFYAKITSDQGDKTSSSVKVSFPSSQTLNYDHTTWWTKHDPINSPSTLSPTTFLRGQDGSEVLYEDEGLDIGSIDNSWADQGAVVVTFYVSNTQPQTCKIDNFTANHTSITQGQTSTLSWGTSNCASVKLNGDIVDLDGSKIVSPFVTTTYNLNAYNQSGLIADSETITINVSQPSQMTGIINSNTSSCIISIGQSACLAKLTWSTQNPVATSSVTNNNATIYVGNNGNDKSINVSYGDQKYYLYNNGLELSNTSVKASCASGSSWSNGYCKQNTIPTITTGDINANPTSCYIPNGSNSCSSLISWSTQNPVATSSVTYNQNNISRVLATGNSGSKTTSINYGSQTFFLYNSGNLLDQVSVNARCASGTSWAGNFCKTTTVTSVCRIDKFTVTPSTINQGDSATLTWSTTGGCTNVNIDGSPVLNSGSQIVSPTSTKTYTLNAENSNGVGVSAQTTVSVLGTANNCRISSFYSDPSYINEGQSSKLFWTTEGCINVNIDGSSVSNVGYQTVSPTSTKTYTLNAENSNGVGVSAQATVHVDEESNSCNIVSFDATDTSIEEGDDTTLRWNTNGCYRVTITSLGDVEEDGSESVSPNSDKTYTLTAYNSNGSTKTDTVRIYVDEDNGGSNNDYCTIDSFTASDTYVNQGDSVTLRWNTTDCDDVDISNIGDVSDDGSETIYPTHSGNYVLSASDDNRDRSKSIYINVESGNLYNSCAVTTVATNVNTTSATLNGLITNSNSGTTNVYFEYGPTVSLGYRTPTRTVYGNSPFSEVVSGLSSNTSYFFRANANCGNNAPGSIEAFTTIGNGYVRPIVIQGTTVTGTQSPIMLKIENRYQAIGVGDVIDYTVYYKNIGKTTLTNPLLQVVIPKGITVTNASRGTYSTESNTLSVVLEDLPKGAEGYVYLQGRVDSITTGYAQIVTTAILVYTNPNGAQENAIAYALNSPKQIIVNGIIDNNTNNLGAAAFFGWAYNIGFCGWLIIILLILLAVLIARSISNKRTTTVYNSNPQSNGGTTTTTHY